MNILDKIKAGVRWRVEALRRSGPAEKFTILPDDTFLVSYPRSGNSWMRFMLTNLMHPERDWHHGNMNEIIPDMYQVEEKIKEYPSPRIIKSHEIYNKVYPKVVYIYRDIRDVVISYYNHDVTCSRKYTGTFRQFLEEMLDGDVGFGSWQEHVRSWMDPSRVGGHIMPIKYELLCEDTEAILMQVADFVGIKTDAQAIESAVRKSSFKNLQKSVEEHSPYYKTGYRMGVKGGPGKWKEVLSENDLQLIWEKAGKEMQMLNYGEEQEGL